MQISCSSKHKLVNVRPLEAQSCSSYDGQLSSQTQVNWCGDEAMQWLWYLQLTFVHGSRSRVLKKIKTDLRDVNCLVDWNMHLIV